ncbi:MAG: Glu-tRNA(Gln) amidotransferase GatDE subunit E, partial [Nanoarchaeota archaeon]|nr:Glu-tRNA(Gln) amidotransferase GatDE subunit E [Nanoarchaeota archaeon]
MDYKKLGLKCGLEIHKQLETNEKLFCSCKSQLSDRNVMKFTRKLRPVAGELGDIDVATLHEVMKNKTYVYSVYPDETCLVETDSEPPHDINREALETVLKVAVMLNCDIPDEIHVMRKTVIDGSNTSGFQRTAIIGINGHIKTSFGNVGIDNISIEE